MGAAPSTSLQTINHPRAPTLKMEPYEKGSPFIQNLHWDPHFYIYKKLTVRCQNWSLINFPQYITEEFNLKGDLLNWEKYIPGIDTIVTSGTTAWGRGFERSAIISRLTVVVCCYPGIGQQDWELIKTLQQIPILFNGICDLRSTKLRQKRVISNHDIYLSWWICYDSEKNSLFTIEVY